MRRSAGSIVRWVGIAAASALLATLSACNRGPPFALTNISGLLPQLQFQLTDDAGRSVSAQNYRGKVVLLYFGYTNCPDVCPTTLAMLSRAVRALGPDASQVRVLFVSVDPRRDTVPLLKRYVGYFGPQFVGLRGDQGELVSFTRRYRVAFHDDAPDQYGNYAVEHSSAVFVFDARGRPRLLAGDTALYQPAALTGDLRRLIDSG